MNTAKFAVWFLLSLILFTILVAICLPLGIVAIDYAGGSPFPIGLTLTASLIAMICLVLIGKDMRKIQTQSSKFNKLEKRLSSKIKQKIPYDEVEFIGTEYSVTSFRQGKNLTKSNEPLKTTQIDEDFFDIHEIIEID